MQVEMIGGPKDGEMVDVHGGFMVEFPAVHGWVVYALELDSERETVVARYVEPEDIIE
jgi:hypothetical protein